MQMITNLNIKLNLNQSLKIPFKQYAFLIFNINI